MDLLNQRPPVMNAQDTTDNIPVHVNAESQGDLRGNAGATPGVLGPAGPRNLMKITQR